MNNTSINAIFKFNAVLLCVVNVFFAFAGLILNFVVIMSLWNSQLRRKLCYFMIFVQACFDLAVVVVIHPLIIFQIISGWLSMNITKSDWVSYFYILTEFSFIALLTMTLERYLALMYPFFHQKFVTKPRLLNFFMLSQLPSVVSNLLYKSHALQNLACEQAVYLAIFGGLLLTICILNLKLFHLSRIIRNRADLTLGNLDASNSEPRNSDTKKFKLTLASLKKISTCLLVLACLFICQVPWTVHFAVKMKKSGRRDQNRFLIDLWTETLITIHCSLNCLIFFYKNNVLRRHGRMFLKKCFCGSLGVH